MLRLGRAARGRWWAGLFAVALAGGSLGCATFPAVGRGGQVYNRGGLRATGGRNPIR